MAIKIYKIVHNFGSILQALAAIIIIQQLKQIIILNEFNVENNH